MYRMKLSSEQLEKFSKEGKLTKNGKRVYPVQVTPKKSILREVEKPKDATNEILSQNKEFLQQLITVLSNSLNKEPVTAAVVQEPSVVEIEPKINVSPIIKIPHPKPKRYHVTVERDSFGDIKSFDIEEEII